MVRTRCFCLLISLNAGKFSLEWTVAFDNGVCIVKEAIYQDNFTNKGQCFKYPLSSTSYLCGMEYMH